MQSGIQSVDRALRLLWAIHRTPGQTLSELAAGSGLLPSTTLRLLATLEQHELIGRDPETRRYGLGAAIPVLAGVSNAEHERIRRAVEPELRRLAHAVGEQAAIGVLDGASQLNIAMVDGAEAAGQSVILRSDADHRQTNLNATAIGKILLAYGRPEATESLIKRLRFTSTASQTITDADALRRHLKSVRRHGYASSLYENMPDVAGIAAPVRGESGTVIAALSINGPVSRLPRQRLLALLPVLQSSATECSVLLGYVES